MLDQLIGDIEGFDAALRRGSSVNINDQSSKDRAIALATRYFSEARPYIEGQLSGTDLSAHDAVWQQLVRLAHGNSARSRYRTTVTQLRKELIDFRIRALTAARATPVAPGRQIVFSTEEALILRTLEGLVPSAAASYRQGLADLNGPERIS